MNGISSKAAGMLENKKKYNGIEYNTDFDLNTYEAFYRNLDPQIGRWWQLDPKIENMEGLSPYNSMANNPIIKSDPLGDEPDDGTEDPPTNKATVIVALALEGSGGTAIGAAITEAIPFVLGAYVVYEYGQFVATHPYVADAAGKGSTPLSAQVASAKYLQSLQTKEESINNGAVIAIGFVKRVQALVLKAEAGKQKENATTNTNSKPSLSQTKDAVKKAQEKVGSNLPRAKGKFGSPMRGNSKKGYRLDPAHPNKPAGDPESVPHINWWDYTDGKRNGKNSDVIPILPIKQ